MNWTERKRIFDKKMLGLWNGWIRTCTCYACGFLAVFFNNVFSYVGFAFLCAYIGTKLRFPKKMEDDINAGR